MPTRPDEKAPSGSTQRPVQDILSIAGVAVALASRSVTAIISGVSNAACFRSAVSSSMLFILNSGQYSQSKFSVRKPLLSPVPIFAACVRISSKLCGGPARPAFSNSVLL